MNLERLIRAVHAAQVLLDGASDDQWQMPPNPVQSVGRSSSVSDPTFNTASDERRLRLRMAMIRTERVLDQLAGVLEAESKNLEKAIDDWQGKT